MLNRRSVGAVLVVVGTLLFVSSAPAAIMGQYGTSYTLDQVQSSGGIYVGDKLFADFTLVSNTSGGALAPQASAVSVTPVKVDGNIGLRFNGAWLALQGQSLDSSLSFSVTAAEGWLIEDAALSITGVSAANGGAISIAESIFSDDPDATMAPRIADLHAWYVNSQNQQLVDHVEFPAELQIWVQKDIVVSGGSTQGGVGHLSIFYQTFSQVPEPATLALLCMGGLVVIRRRIRRG